MGDVFARDSDGVGEANWAGGDLGVCGDDGADGVSTWQ
jgi:hypothetical protein